MKKLMQASVFVAAGLVAGIVVAQQVKPDKKAIMEAMHQMSAPAPEHQFLQPLVGTFNQTIEYEGGGGEPVFIEGDASGKWVLGNRFVQMNAASNAAEQLKFESIGYFGYDTQKKKFTAVGLDTGGTYAVFAEGDYDPKTKTWTLEGENDEVGIGRVPFRFVIRQMPDETIVHEVLFKLPGSGDFKRVARTVYKKK